MASHTHSGIDYYQKSKYYNDTGERTEMTDRSNIRITSKKFDNYNRYYR